jgi:hypothetical protein
MNTVEAMPVAFVGFSTIAALTWFFSSRPRLFLRVFVPPNEWLGIARTTLKKREEFRRGMRIIAGLQFGAACVFGLIGLWLRA